MGSPKEPAWRSGLPRGLSSIATTVIALAVFLTFTTLLLASHPIGSTVRGYFYDVRIQKEEMPIYQGNEPQINGHDKNRPLNNSGSGHLAEDTPTPIANQNAVDSGKINYGDMTNKNVHLESGETKTLSYLDHNEVSGLKSQESNQSTIDAKGDSIDKKIDENRPLDNSESGYLAKDTPTPIANQNVVDLGKTNNGEVTNKNMHPGSGETKASSDLGHDEASLNSSHYMESMRSPVSRDATKVEAVPSVSPLPSEEASKSDSVDSGCDLYQGQWVYDTSGPLYSNNTCPILTQMQNCQGNGRPDKDYENWRWKPSHCDLPRFDAKKFLELMRGKTLAFVGDSVARNQMESMMCILWQVEAPINKGNKKMHRWFFKSTSTMIVRLWSSWLVHQTSEKLDYAPEGITKLHLDAPDMTLMEFLPRFDVIVLSSGHWFAKQSVYVLNNEIVGGQLWWPKKDHPMEINNIEAFAISVETILNAMATHPKYKGLTIVRSYSPDHYEGGAWNTGGSCTGKVKPMEPGALVENGFTSIMHEKQVQGFDKAMKKTGDRSKLHLMDITKPFSYRHDGHPGPYRSPDPNKLTKRGPDGRPPPQDCLHWCMPGPVDTWNELVLEVIRREFEGKRSSAS